MKKLFDWLGFGGTEEKDFPFFREKEEGQELFYPWGFSGECFLVNKAQKNKITYFFLSISISMLLYLCGIIILLYFQISFLPNILAILFFLIFPYIYLFSIYCFYISKLYVQHYPSNKVGIEGTNFFLIISFVQYFSISETIEFEFYITACLIFIFSFSLFVFGIILIISKNNLIKLLTK